MMLAQHKGKRVGWGSFLNSGGLPSLPHSVQPGHLHPAPQRLDSDVLLIQHDAHSPRQFRRLFPRPTAGDGVDSIKSCPLPHRSPH